MAPTPGVVSIPSSPSFDTEAASQQLLAEAISPVRCHTTTPTTTSIAAQRGATLLNAARALPKPLVMTPAPATRGGKLPKSGPPKFSKLPKTGGLKRVSLSSLVSEGSQKKARGKQMYDVGPSPEKKRSSLPAQIAALEDEEDVILPETSQVQPNDDESAEIPETLDVSAPTEAFGDNDILDPPTSPVASSEEVAPATKKQRGRPRKGGDSVSSLAAEEVEFEQPASSVTELSDEDASSAPKKRRGRPRKSGDSVASRTNEAGGAKPQEEVQKRGREESPAAPKKHRGWSRKSGDSKASQTSEAGAAKLQDEEVQGKVRVEHAQPIPTVKTKRKANPDGHIDKTTSFEPSNKGRPAKKLKKLKGPKMVNPGEPSFKDDVLAPIATLRQDAPQQVPKDARQESREVRRQERGQDAQTLAQSRAEVRILYRPTHSRATRAQAEPATTSEAMITAVPVAAIGRKGMAAQRIAQETRAAILASAPEPVKRKNRSRKIQISSLHPAPATEVDGENDEEAAQATAERNGNRHLNGSRVSAADDTNDDAEEQNDGQEGDVEIDSTTHNQASSEGQDGERHDEQDEDAEDEDAEEKDAEDEDVEGAGGRDDDDATTERSTLPTLGTVFNFVHDGERPGLCAVGLARQIHRTCDRALVTLSGEGCSFDQITASKDNIIHRLASIRTNIQEDTRCDFKRDAFAYLFRVLTRVLEAMHDNLQEKVGEVRESLEAMQVLHPFICEMLGFKDTMDSWKVKLQGRGQGDRIIKGVESGLIAPLRVVEKDLKKRLSALRKAEQDRQTRIEFQRQREKEEQKMVNKEESLRSMRERRKRWQDLHIARMQCEPDPHRRRRLRFVEVPAMAETDANGNQFERVPFFGERSAPPPSSVTLIGDREWSEKQDTVLLDALQSSASLERIFRRHCGPGGALRDLSVSDFANKLAWVRSAWAQLSHQHGWELPEWVKNTPVLP
ncbi:uncharacterized protein M421DRAFT_424092 [Didymella exigua CBS 183.55]|uniref:Uncharacterized protein n=1 Tax=Didymella exigua CBS 183.55 TaxID=1150837 RepID=A0A6A5RA19_9PLEO|nr:uncharacterized protein M421DRAFT_424092 [Didymella exigua CBS 183.55]KAF1925065.1 hypothetical protein M421DRAFT_424092 [Didymella exigua CBS 183.55]